MNAGGWLRVLGLCAALAGAARGEAGPDAQTCMEQALRCRLEGDLTAAASWCRRGLETDPGGSRLWCLMGDVYSLKGDVAQSPERIRQRMRFDPDDDALWLETAVALQDAGRLEEAQKAAGRAVALNPDWPQARVALGQILGLAGDFAGEMRELRGALDAGASTDDVYERIPVSVVRRHAYDEARNCYGQALLLNPNGLQTLCRLGEHYLKLIDVYAFEIHREKALQCFLRAVQLDFASPLLHFRVFSLYRDKDAQDEARAYLERNTVRMTDRLLLSEAYLSLGDIFMRKRRISDSRRALVKSLAYDPRSGDAMERLGLLDLAAGDRASVLDRIQKLRAMREPVLADDLQKQLQARDAGRTE